MDEGAGLSSAQGPEYGELWWVCHARALGCPARHHWRTGKDPEMTQGSSGTIWDMKEIQPKAQSPPTPEKTLAWEPLECFRFHPHEPMIFLEVGITLIPYSLLHPPMDIWHIGGGALLPVAFQRALTLEHTGPLNVCKSTEIHIVCISPRNQTKKKCIFIHVAMSPRNLFEKNGL